MKTEGRPEAAPQSRSQERTSSRGHLRAARREAVFEYLRMPGLNRPIWLPLGAETFASLRHLGLLKADVDQALADLAVQGRVEFEVRPFGRVFVRMLDVETESAA